MSAHRSARLAFLLLLYYNLSTAQTAVAPSAGDGSLGDPYQIATLDNLYWITQNSSEWGKHYIQTAAIDASSSSGWDGGNGYSPIGNNAASFTGTYNGQGYVISGLTSARTSSDYIGMFGSISDAALSNITLTGVSMSGASMVGGLVGFMTGSGSALVTGCSSAGAVSGTTSNIGGLIGKTQAGSAVTTSFSTASVSSSSGNNLGGFIGYHDQSSSISACYSRGNVSTPGGDHAGGFVGTIGNTASITNCYAAGTVSSYNRAGGFAGSKSSGSITNCYSTGNASIDGGSSVGGFIALNAGTVSNCFWDTEASGNASSAAGTGKTTAEMKSSSTFTDAGWNFTTVWEMVGVNYPRLRDTQDQNLPVELSFFTAAVRGAGVELRWSTASETKNAGFDVERSEHASWRSVGFVPGHGTASGPRSYGFVDAGARGTVRYRLKQSDTDGRFRYSHEIEVIVAVPVPASAGLEQNFPNPFNPSTTIVYHVAEAGAVTLAVYDLLGRNVATLSEGVKQPGRYSVPFDASRLAGGVYIARLTAGRSTLVRRMNLIR